MQISLILSHANHFREMEYWTKIFDEVEKFSDMEEFNIMMYVKNKDKLAGGDCLVPFTIDEVSKL